MTMRPDRLTLESEHDILEFDSTTLGLLSFRAKSAPEQEFISNPDQAPVFIIGYLDAKRQYRWLYSYQTEGIEIAQADIAGRRTLKATYSRLAGYDLQVTCQMSASPQEPFIRWCVSLLNDAGLEVVDVQY